MTQTLIVSLDAGVYGVDSYGLGPYGGVEQFDLDVTSISNRGRKSSQWETCARCGFFYPISEMRLQPGDGGNVKVCVEYCYDQPSIEDLKPMELPKEAPYLFVDEDGPGV